MKFLNPIFFLLSLGGCAITSTAPVGPNGRPVHSIDAMSSGTAYKKAGDLCPSGYYVIGKEGYTSPIDYEMTIECK